MREGGGVSHGDSVLLATLTCLDRQSFRLPQKCHLVAVYHVFISCDVI